MLQKTQESREEGFTLIEMMVVILIIGLLVAIAVPVYLNQKKNSVDSAVKTEVNSAAVTVETWAVSHPRGIPNQAVIANVKTSQGTVLTLTSSEPEKYIITGTNPKGNQAANPGIIYDSKVNNPF